MKLVEKNITETIEEMYLLETLNLNNKTILELGCGAAAITKKVALNGFNRKIIACEVDEIQHKKNLELNIKNIEFKLSGAEDIKVEDNSVDFIMMFKSFHHIPINKMQKALNEIQRVLKPNALAYISEPLFYGDLSDLIPMFHNEEYVREETFKAIEKSVKNEQFKLFREIFFQTPTSYENFEDFKSKLIDVSYNDHNFSKEFENKIKDKFNELSNNQKITFQKPFRVDILQNVK